MKKLRQDALVLPEGLFLVPLIVGPNKLERNAFLDILVELLQAERPLFVTDNRISPLELLDDKHDAIFFHHGDGIDRTVQDVLMSGKLQRFRYALAIIQHDVATLQRERLWSPDFCDHAVKTLVWPKWHEREQDKPFIVSELLRHLSLPDGLPGPEADAGVITYLIRSPFEGSDDVKRAVSQALTRYITREDMGPLQLKHFVPEDAPTTGATG